MTKKKKTFWKINHQVIPSMIAYLIGYVVMQVKNK